MTSTSIPEGDPTSERSFLVTVPAHEAHVLGRIAAGMSWSVQPLEGVTTPDASERPQSGLPITAARIGGLAMDLWGEVYYGSTASSIVRRKIELVSRVSEDICAGEVGEPLKRGYGLLYQQGIDTREIIFDGSLAAVRQLLLRHWDATINPYTLGVTVAHGPTSVQDGYRRILRANLGDLDQGRLARFMQTEFSGHALHGALGKAFDVLDAAAGVLTRSTASGEVDMDEALFITYKEMLALARKYGLKDTAWNALRDRIGSQILEQVQTGRPVVSGEVVVEGPVDVAQRNAGPKYQKIARSSIVAAAETLRAGNPAIQFAREHFGS